MKHCKEWDLMRWTMCQLVQDFFHPLYVKISEMGLQKWWGIPHTMNMVERGKYDMEYYYGILYPNPPTMLGIHASSCSHWFYCLHMDTDNYSLRFHDPLHLYRKISMNSFKILSWKQSPWFRSFFCRNGGSWKCLGTSEMPFIRGRRIWRPPWGFYWRRQRTWRRFCQLVG